jgi:prepilin-type N-terminal cleavage/methylation domain-containing protein
MELMKPTRRRHAGFTMVELVLATTVLGILSTSAIVPFVEIHQQAQQSSENSTVASVSQGVGHYLSESSVTGRSPLYPLTLDNAPTGSATPASPYFADVLLESINEDWRKTGPNNYIGPAGGEFTYDPTTGSFLKAEQNPFSQFGNIIGQTSQLLAFDSGALVSTVSDLLYNPNYETGAVEARLASGIGIQTDGTGGATITLSDGTEVTVDNIYNRWTELTKNQTTSTDGLNYQYDYAAVGYGRAYEGSSNANYTRRDRTYDSATGSYNYDYEYTYGGSYSAVGLSTDNGYVYEGSYQANNPITYQATRTVSDDGSYTGSYNSAYDTSATYSYGQASRESPSGQSVQSTYGSNYAYDYNYSTSTGDYTTAGSGQNSYDYTYENLDGSSTTQADTYNYETTYTNNRNTGAYSGSTAYTSQSGSDYNYSYNYNPSTRTYSYTYTNNVTGETRDYSYRR